MKLSTTITLAVVIIPAGIAILTGTALLGWVEKNMQQSFSDRLAERLQNAADVVLEEDELSRKEHLRALRLLRSGLPNERLAIVDSSLRIVFYRGFDDDTLVARRILQTTGVARGAPQQGDTFVWARNADTSVAAMVYLDNNLTYYVAGSAVDTQGMDHLRELRYALGMAAGIMLLLLFATARYIVRQFVSPFEELVRKANELSTSGEALFRLPTDFPVAEVKQFAQSFNAIAVKLEESANSRKRFFALAAHELRTPLAAMLTVVSVALHRSREREEYKEALENCLSLLNASRKKIQSLLLLARLAEGNGAFATEPIAFDEVIYDAVDHVQMANPGRTISVKYSQGNIDTQVHANAELLKIVFSNILDNALRYSPPTQPVEVSIDVAGGRVRCTVDDGGEGISDGDWPKAIEAFSRLTPGSTEGTGLGLSLVHEIVSLHGGTLSASRNGRGGASISVELYR